MELDTVYSNIEFLYNNHGQEYGIINPRFTKNSANQITWHNHLSNEKFETYEEYYSWANENFQYSFGLQDDSLVQLYFEGKQEGRKIIVTKGSMAFLPNPYSYSEYYRFDIDTSEGTVKDYSHPTYHIHFGYRAKDVRFTLYIYPMPTEFLKLIEFLHFEKQIKKYSESKFWESLEERNVKFNHSLDFIV